MSLRILIVDDATFVRDTIKRTLRNFIPGVEIHDAINGHRAVAVLKAHNINIILSDWEMPEMSGEELLQWVRSQEKYLKTPFIMISSRGEKEHVVKAIQAGVSDYMAKPFTPEELQNKVTKQLDKIGFKNVYKATAAEGSIAALTGAAGAISATKKTKPGAVPPTQIKEGLAAFAKPASQTKSQAKPSARKNTAFSGTAQLRFPSGAHPCNVLDLTLQALNGIMARPEQIPAVFDQVVLDLSNAKGEAVARINGYVHGLTAFDLKPDSQKVKIMVRFVDDDPVKIEALSMLITR